MNREAIEYFKSLKQDEYAFTERDKEMFDVAIQALETISHLKDRPCEACEYHSDRGCSKWDCVFDKVLYGGD